MDLIQKANIIFKENFPLETNFERAIFCSWSCFINTCKYCYMSTQPRGKRSAQRSLASIAAEAIITKKLGWELAYITGGTGIHTDKQYRTLVQLISKIDESKITTNFGPMSKQLLEKNLDYINGVGCAVETFIPKLQKKICPDKPLTTITRTLDHATDLRLKKLITIILGLGETLADFPMLKKFIQNYKIDKIQFCVLKPQKNTEFESVSPPNLDYMAIWIAKTRITFPTIQIKAAILPNHIDNLPIIFHAGANTFSRFPAIKQFGSKQAYKIEQAINESGRTFKGTLTKLPNINWDNTVHQLPIDNNLKNQIKIKLNQYLKVIKNTIKNNSHNTINHPSS